jgi:hypothetical protein
MLMVAIAEESRKGPLNLNDCYNWVTFDGTLSFVPCLNISDTVQSSGNLHLVKRSGRSKPARPMNGLRQS